MVKITQQMATVLLDSVIGYETYNLLFSVVSFFNPFKSEASIWIMRLLLAVTLRRSFRSKAFVWYIFGMLNIGRYDVICEDPGGRFRLQRLFKFKGSKCPKS